MVRRLSTKPRLDAAAWIDAALEALADEGQGAIRVEPLAQRLGVTKGSFYWHFRDREDLLHRTLAQWQAARIAAIREQAAEAANPKAALAALIDIYARAPNPKGLAVELAIRALARNQGAAADAVALVDAERLARVAELFARAGLPPDQAQARALLFYAFLFGQSLLGGRRQPAKIAEAARMVLTI
ncbi:MAG: TetR/AcrR family transcriptional regulator [Proteobacteria bacterium]|nr:TetR/AcrR family transcriptional regulator [Pseudomonadota bacterium]